MPIAAAIINLNAAESTRACPPCNQEEREGQWAARPPPGPLRRQDFPADAGARPPHRRPDSGVASPPRPPFSLPLQLHRRRGLPQRDGSLGLALPAALLPSDSGGGSGDRAGHAGTVYGSADASGERGFCGETRKGRLLNKIGKFLGPILDIC